ncbi:MAG: ferrochelatase [Betaproteobacteria bacterium]|nr:MAG: ferrochelatase [Betaproteobacteria bacterium]
MQSSRSAVLLVNLGTPTAPTAEAVRAYLAEFLSDPRVVELPRLLWLPILHGIVLRTRPAKSAEKYRLIWTAEGSPLAVHTARQANLLAQETGSKVEYAMRYGGPTIASALAKLSNPVVLPLYPQYSASTTSSVLDLLPPSVRVVREFHDHPAYIHALAANVDRHWAEHGRGERLVMSFHGLPQRAVDRGDPYQRHCLATAELLARSLGLSREAFVVTFQSRFGFAEWLQPYTQPTLVAMAKAGTKRVDVVCPGFVSDCLETLEEIGIAARQAFLAAGGREFHLVPCLNESPEWIAALERLALG